MKTLKEHHSQKTVKLLGVGDPGSGKTGSLVSLVKAGYRLVIADTDNGLDILSNLIAEQCPEKADQVSYETFRDKMEISGGEYKPIGEHHFVSLVNWINSHEWLKEAAEGKHDKTIFVLDTFTGLSSLCMNIASVRMNANSSSGKSDKRQIYGAGQDYARNLVLTLFGDEFKSHLICFAHIEIIDTKDAKGEKTQGYPHLVSRGLSTKIGALANTVFHYLQKGSDARVIETKSSPLLLLKNSKPGGLNAEYPINTGLADIFSTLVTGE